MVEWQAVRRGGDVMQAILHWSTVLMVIAVIVLNLVSAVIARNGVLRVVSVVLFVLAGCWLLFLLGVFG